MGRGRDLAWAVGLTGRWGLGVLARVMAGAF